MSFIAHLQEIPLFFISLCTITGLMIGSFLNVVIYRLPKMIEQTWRQQCAELHGERIAAPSAFNIATPRSMCPNCKHQITALENIPILSYLLLKGRCTQCHVRISPRYPIVEALTGIISGFIAWHFGFGLMTLAALIFAWAMITLALIDLDTQLLPDDITLPLLWIGLLINLKGGFTDIHSAIMGAVIGYLTLWSIFWGFKIITGKEGMGYGDFKLLAAIGAWFGWVMLPLVILLSSLAGTIIGIGLMFTTGHKKDNPIPFGPYLAIGGLVALFWGNQINHRYFALF
ncbi:MAG: A24 family peptidase [Nitrosomonas sp.]|nr:A24 family peptidase [Nitrosomonas sp.]MDP1950198.1 A24 family peptidase [Nitrosomonas sp.]